MQIIIMHQCKFKKSNNFQEDPDTCYLSNVKMIRKRIGNISCYVPDEQNARLTLPDSSPFIAYKIQDSDVFIRKSTALWIMCEHGHLSSDRLLRVQDK